MSTISLLTETVQDRESVKRLWISTGAVLFLGAVAFGAAFWSEVVHAVGVWEASTAYNHCFLIVPISLYLLWERREAALARLPAANFWPLLAMLPVALVWLVAYKVDVMEGRQLAAMTLFELFLLSVLGFQLWRVIAFALLYLFFLVPTGAFLTPWLQNFAAHFAVRGLEIVGIPVYFQQEGMLIEVPGATFTVAEACAGLRFLIASVALGALYGYLMYRSWTRRVIFLVVSIIVPIIANGLRVMGISVLGYLLSSAQAATADHIIYGWLFFSFVSLVLILLGLPFRQPMAQFVSGPVDRIPARHAQVQAIVAGALFAFLVLGLTSPIMTKGPMASALDSSVAGLKHALGR
ncbi:MAG TPA: exosortase A [Alphaproteobacteria bacterium]|nr:exosortase A [Alphaproteobacteria bacterium]